MEEWNIGCLEEMNTIPVFQNSNKIT